MATMTKKLGNNDLADVMFNRHSVRDFDPAVKIDRDEIQEMLSEAATAPSAPNNAFFLFTTFIFFILSSCFVTVIYCKH